MTKLNSQINIGKLISALLFAAHEFVKTPDKISTHLINADKGLQTLKEKFPEYDASLLIEFCDSLKTWANYID